MTGSAAWKAESVKTMKLGESVTLGDFTYRLDGVEPIRGLLTAFTHGDINTYYDVISRSK